MSNKAIKNPLLWVPTTYFAMGFPYITLSMVLVVMFKDLGIDNETITQYTSMLVIPWSLKPLFSPFMEIFGTKKKYTVYTELISSIMLGLVVVSLPLPNYFIWIIAAMGVLAISGSVHDIAGDGIYMEQLDATTQSVYSGWQGAFYNMAKVLANGALVFLAGWLVSHVGLSARVSWQIIMGCSATIMFVISVYHMFFLPRDKKTEIKQTLNEKFNELANVFLVFIKKKHILYYVFFIIMYRFAEGLAMKVAPLFLKDDIEKGGLALSNEQYGLIYGTFGAAAFIIGSIAAGYYVSRFGLKKTLFTLALAFNIPFVVYLLFAILQPCQTLVIALGIVFEYFGYGFGFVGLTLFMMQQIAPGKHRMSHYAFANSIMNLGVLIPGYISGYLSEKKNQVELLNHLNLLDTVPNNLLGYKLFFIVVMVCTIPALLATFYVPFTYTDQK